MYSNKTVITPRQMNTLVWRSCTLLTYPRQDSYIEDIYHSLQNIHSSYIFLWVSCNCTHENILPSNFICTEICTCVTFVTIQRLYNYLNQLLITHYFKEK